MKLDKKKQSKNLQDARSARDMHTLMVSATSMQNQKRNERYLKAYNNPKPLNKKLLGFDENDMMRSIRNATGKKQDRLARK